MYALCVMSRGLIFHFLKFLSRNQPFIAYTLRARGGISEKYKRRKSSYNAVTCAHTCSCVIVEEEETWQKRTHRVKNYVVNSDTPQFRGGNPYFF